MTDSNAPSDRDVNRAIRSWLHEDRHEDASRVAGAVLDQTETTRQRRATWWPARRTPNMNKIVPLGLGAVAVVVALVVGAQFFRSSDGGIGGQPAPTATPEPTPEPTPKPTPEPTPVAGLPTGPHLILTGQADDPANNIPPLTVTIPGPGWDADGNEVGGEILTKNDRRPPNGSGMIIFVGREYTVYGDACHWKTTAPDKPVTTVDEFVAALSSQGSVTASKPVDITWAGTPGNRSRSVSPMTSTSRSVTLGPAPAGPAATRRAATTRGPPLRSTRCTSSTSTVRSWPG